MVWTELASLFKRFDFILPNCPSRCLYSIQLQFKGLDEQCQAWLDYPLSFSACQSLGTGMMLSSWATSSIEEVAEAGPEALRWLQLYIYKDREVTKKLVRQAEKTGYKAIFVTVDTPYLGNRLDDVRNRFKLPPQLR